MEDEVWLLQNVMNIYVQQTTLCHSIAEFFLLHLTLVMASHEGLHCLSAFYFNKLISALYYCMQTKLVFVFILLFVC